MYTPISLLYVPKGVNKRWMEKTVDVTSVSSLMLNNRKTYVKVKVLPDPTIRVLDLQQFAPQYADYSGTLTQMFTALGDSAAVELSAAPAIDMQVAKFRDARQAGYKCAPIHPTYGFNVPLEQRTDLLLTRDTPIVDYSSFITKCLVSVNGFYHMIETDGSTGVWVKDGGKSLLLSNQSQFGIYSFSRVAPIHYYPITRGMLQKRLSPEMIAGTAPQDPFSKIGFVKVNANLTNKSIIMVIGGYLITPDSDIVTRVNDNEFQIDFQRIPLVQRYYESSHYIDMSSLGLSTTNANSSQVSVEELLSDVVLKKYLCLSQSFVVVVDTPELFVNRYFVRKTGSPGVYESYQEPIYPLQAGIGRMPEYWVTPEDGIWSLSSTDAYNRQKIFNTTDPALQRSVSASSLPFDPELYFGACLVEIGRDLKK